MLKVMPDRKAGEPLGKFIGRFMKAKRDQKWKPKQRLAIGYSEARKEAHAKG